MKLRSHILSVVIPLILAPILILGWVSLNNLRENAEQRLLSQLSSELQKISSQSEAAIQAIENDLEILSTFSVVHRYLLTDDEESRYTIVLPSLLKLFQTFQDTHKNYYEIKILWPDGYEDARSALREINNESDDESATIIFQELMKDSVDKITGIYANPDTQSLALVTGKTMALIDRSSDLLTTPPTVRGHLIITSDLSPFIHLASSARVGRTGMFFITDDQGNVIYHPHSQYIGRSVLDSPDLSAARINRQDKIIVKDFSGKNVYLSHIDVRNKLHIYGQLEADEVLESGDALSKAVFLIVTLSIFITATLVYLAINRLIIAPINQLGIAVNDMQYGEFKRKIDIQSKNELGQLARAFENMGNELQKSHDRIHTLAYYDDLTKLPNRAMFKIELDRTLAYCKRHQQRFALMFVDVDNFKHVNDVFGHHAGDHLLATVSERLRSSLRGEDVVAVTRSDDETDVVARIGGDEFIVLLPNLPSPMAAHTVAQRMIDTMTQPILIENDEVFVGASIGIALFPDDGDDAENLLRNADMAMYHAKTSGKNRLQFFGDAINLATTARLNLESRLRKAIQNNLLEIYYQPILSLDNELIIGAEALLRWNDEELGFVPPDKFISIAEESGLIIQLGEWVLLNACKQNQHWHNNGLSDLFIAVNVSGVQITRGDLDDVVAKIIRASGIDAQRLCLEVTETSVVSAIDRAQKVLKAIRRLGVKIALDDFGTGYSSLSYLRKLPIDHLKIDRSFIADISEDKEDETIISAIIAMSKNLDIEIVAEGIETSEQLRFLRQRSCDMGQGYLFSKPIPAKDFERVARANRRQHMELPHMT